MEAQRSQGFGQNNFGSGGGDCSWWTADFWPQLLPSSPEANLHSSWRAKDFWLLSLPTLHSPHSWQIRQTLQPSNFSSITTTSRIRYCKVENNVTLNHFRKIINETCLVKCTLMQNVEVKNHNWNNDRTTTVLMIKCHLYTRHSFTPRCF